MATVGQPHGLTFEMLLDTTGAPTSILANPQLYLVKPGAVSFITVTGAAFTNVSGGVFKTSIPGSYLDLPGLYYAAVVAGNSSSRSIEIVEVDSEGLDVGELAYVPFAGKALNGTPLESLAFSTVTVTLSLEITAVKPLVSADFVQLLDGLSNPTSFYLIKLSAADLNVEGTLSYSVDATGMQAFESEIEIVEKVTVEFVTKLVPTVAAVKAEYFEDGARVFSGQTDAFGEMPTSLKPGIYRVRLQKADIVFDRNNVEVEVVAATTSVELDGNFTELETTQEGFCRISFKLVRPDGQPFVRTAVSFLPILSTSASGSGIVPLPLQSITNGLGEGEVFLLKGMQVRVTIEGTRIYEEFTVPDTDAAELFTLITFQDKGFDLYVANLPAAPRRSM